MAYYDIQVLLRTRGGATAPRKVQEDRVSKALEQVDKWIEELKEDSKRLKKLDKAWMRRM